MTIGEQIKRKQPLIYNFLIDLFGLSMAKTDRVEPAEFEEDDYNYRYFKRMMEERRGFKL